MKVSKSLSPLPGLLFAVALLIATSTNSNAAVTLKPIPDVRIMAAAGKFAGTEMLATALPGDAPKWLGADRLEYILGGLKAEDNSASFVSAGPVWRWGKSKEQFYIELGFSPTLLSDSTFTEKDMGGKFHFSSSLEIGQSFGRNGQSSFTLRIQHLSNGGIKSINPGLDMVGLSYITYF